MDPQAVTPSNVTPTNASANAPEAPPSLDYTLGIYLLGTFVSTMLYGLVLHQAYRYVRLFPKDTLFIRTLVGSVLVLVTAHTIVIIHTSYFYLVQNYFKPSTLLHSVWSFNFVSLIVGANMLVSQLFFVRRVYLMGRMFRVIAVLATGFFIAENGFALGALVKGLSLTSFTQFAMVNQIVAVTFVLSALGDTLLAISLFVVIARNCESSPTSEKPAANAFITYVINTGMLHDILNVLSIVLAVGFPTTLWSQAVNHITTKVYAITLLTVLNMRTLSFTDGVQVYDRGEQYGRNIIARADNLATKERWNVPQVTNPAPAVIDISVATEMEDERNAHWFKRSESTSSSTYKSRDNMV